MIRQYLTAALVTGLGLALMFGGSIWPEAATLPPPPACAQGPVPGGC